MWSWFHKLGFWQGTASQIVEKVDVAVVFGWRSGLPLRYVLCFEFGFSR